MVSRFESTFRDRVIPAAQRAFGVTVQFVQEGQSSDEFTARRTERVGRVLGFGAVGTGIAVVMRDYTLPVSSVVINGSQVDPVEGNKITEGDDTFEICPPDDGTSAVVLQAGGVEWLVHTKQVAS
jgi:hypothetical protein